MKIGFIGLGNMGAPMAQRHVDDLFFYCTLGVILGGRLGYALFYKPELFVGFEGDGFVSWELLRLWDGGMSFHGGVLGVLVAIAFVCRQGETNPNGARYVTKWHSTLVKACSFERMKQG